MKRLHLDLSAGASGDMFVGALIDLGADPREIERQLSTLPVGGYHLHVGRRSKMAIQGVKFDVHVESEGSCHHGHDHGHDHPHDHPAHGRTFAQIRALIDAAPLNPWVRQKAVAVFHRIAVAEGKIHGVPPEHVAFHEVGAVDSIVDIVGACIALDLLGRPLITAGEVVEGTGFVRCAHGRMPLPAPATLEILGARSIPISQCDEPHEMLTPTGAALLAEFAERFGPMQGVVGAKVGYGVGTRDHWARANVLRALLWEDSPSSADRGWETDRVVVLETNLDDVTAEVLGHALEKAMRLGALDAFHTPVHMKKNRPGVLFTILCREEEADDLTELLLVETTAFGVRRTVSERRKLAREVILVGTEHGEVAVKVGRLGGRVVQASPEYESCRSVAAMAGVTVREVMEATLAAWRSCARQANVPDSVTES